jgi:hypothetical protein
LTNNKYFSSPEGAKYADDRGETLEREEPMRDLFVARSRRWGTQNNVVNTSTFGVQYSIFCGLIEGQSKTASDMGHLWVSLHLYTG